MTKRSKQIIKICVIIAVVSIAIVAMIIISNYRNAIRKQYADVKLYKSECDEAVQWIRENMNGGRHFVSTDSNTYKLGSYELPDNVAKAIKIIDGTFTDVEYLDCVEVSYSRIIFWSFGGDHALVYSSKGRPWRIDGKFVFSERICRGWYHVTIMK